MWSIKLSEALTFCWMDGYSFLLVALNMLASTKEKSALILSMAPLTGAQMARKRAGTPSCGNHKTQLH